MISIRRTVAGIFDALEALPSVPKSLSHTVALPRFYEAESAIAYPGLLLFFLGLVVAVLSLALIAVDALGHDAMAAELRLGAIGGAAVLLGALLLVLLQPAIAYPGLLLFLLGLVVAAFSVALIAVDTLRHDAMAADLRLGAIGGAATLLGALLLVLLCRMMQRPPTSEMRAWLEIYKREFPVRGPAVPQSKLEFARFVRGAYRRREAAGRAGALGALG